MRLSVKPEMERLIESEEQRKFIQEQEMPISIQPNNLYTRSELIEMIGAKGYLACLDEGLAAISGKYLGRIIIDTLHAAAKNRGNQRVMRKKGVGYDSSREAKEKRVDESPSSNTIHTVSAHEESAEMVREMEELFNK